MFDAIAFKHEVTVESRTYLVWEGTFQGNNVAGLTVLTKDAAGLIESIRVLPALQCGGRVFGRSRGSIGREHDCGPLLGVSVTGASVTRRASAVLSPSFRPATAIPS
jgi:hypothetical protein